LVAALGAACGRSEDILIGSDLPTDAGVSDTTIGPDASNPGSDASNPGSDATNPVSDAASEADRAAGSGDAAVDATASDGSVDAPGGSEAGDAGSPFDPLSVPGIVLWLKAGRGVSQSGGGVVKWADQTAYHNDATAVPGQEPTLVASAIHGLPALHFDNGVASGTGNQLTIADSSSLQFGTGDFYVAVVTSFVNDLADGPEAGVGLLYGKTTVGSSAFAPFLSANIPAAISSNQTGMAFATSFTGGNVIVTNTPYNDGTPRLFAMERTGLTIGLHIGLTFMARNVPSIQDVSSVGNPVEIGGYQNAQSLRLDGDVAEVVAVAGTLSAADRQSLENYLLSKYDLAADGG
jgi:hypothetical protein